MKNVGGQKLRQKQRKSVGGQKQRKRSVGEPRKWLDRK